MKKWTASFFLALVSNPLFALPLGNPADPALLWDGLFMDCEFPDPFDPCFALNWTLRAGYYGDFVFDRHLEMQKRPVATIEDTTVMTNAFYLAINFCNRIDLFGTLGATHLSIIANAGIFGLTTGATIDIETETDLSWSLGARALLWQCGCTFFGIEAQYFKTRPGITHISLACTESAHPNHCIDVKYEEWQIGGGIAHHVGKFVPYFGARYTSLRVDMDEAVIPVGAGTAYLHDLRRSRNGGFSLGVSYVGCEKTSITAEYRWPDEKALYINGQVRF